MHTLQWGTWANRGFKNFSQKFFFFLGGGAVFSLLVEMGESLCQWPKTYSSLPHQEQPCHFYFTFIYTQVMLILILINFQCLQCLQNVVFSFEKGLSGEYHSLSNNHHPIETILSDRFPIPLTPQRYLENPGQRNKFVNQPPSKTRTSYFLSSPP